MSLFWGSSSTLPCKKKVVQSEHQLGQKKEIHKNLFINLLQRHFKNNTKDGSEAHLQRQDKFQIQKIQNG